MRRYKVNWSKYLAINFCYKLAGSLKSMIMILKSIGGRITSEQPERNVKKMNAMFIKDYRKHQITLSFSGRKEVLMRVDLPLIRKYTRIKNIS
jgi:hypothetical protein